MQTLFLYQNKQVPNKSSLFHAHIVCCVIAFCFKHLSLYNLNVAFLLDYIICLSDQGPTANNTKRIWHTILTICDWLGINPTRNKFLSVESNVTDMFFNMKNEGEIVTYKEIWRTIVCFYCCFVTPLSQVRGRVERSPTGLTPPHTNVHVPSQEPVAKWLSFFN